jgi:hypothetical protein
VGSDLSGKATKTSVGSDKSGKESNLFGTGIENGSENDTDINIHNDFFAEASDTALKTGYDTQSDAFLTDKTDPFTDKAELPVDTVHEPVPRVLHQGSTTSQIKSLLDRWEEPVNKVSFGQHSFIIVVAVVVSNKHWISS